MSIVEYTGPSNPQDIRKYLKARTKDVIICEYLRLWREFGKVEAERDALAVEVDRLKACWEEEQRGEADLRDILERAKAERDALAAHVERLADLVQASINGIEWYRDRFSDDFGEADEEHLTSCRRALEELEETPTASLARLKAQWQADLRDILERAKVERDQLAQLVPLLNDFLNGELIDDINRDDNGFFGPCYEEARAYQRKVATKIARVLDRQSEGVGDGQRI